MIPYSRHNITEDDIAAVAEVMRSDYLTRGPMVPRFESELALIYNKEHAVCMTNATLALYAALWVSGTTSVTSPALTFMAIANATAIAGIPLFLTDVDKYSLRADFYSGPSRYDNGKPCFVPMDYAGLPWEPKIPLPKNYMVIRDACHSFGAPSWLFARDDMTILSLHAVKQLGVSEGSVIFTDNEDYATLLKRYRDNGRVDGSSASIGLNLHMSDIPAAIGLSKLKRWEKEKARRWEIARRYLDHWKNDNRLILPPDSENHAWHLFVIRLTDRVRCNRNDFRELLKTMGVGSQLHYQPLYLQPVLADRYNHSAFPVTNEAYARMLSIPLYSSMTDEQVETVVK